MSTEDIPVVLAVADSLATPGSLTDQQRMEALESIEFLRRISPQFLDKAEQLIKDGVISEIHSMATMGSRMNSALVRICKALWVLEDDVFRRRDAEIAMMGKEVNNAE
jgi:hypothetical protein